MIIGSSRVFCDCHIHIFMDGVDYRKAAARHRSSPDETAVRSNLETYRQAGIRMLRDGGDPFGVSLLAKKLAPEYGITYRTPVFAIHKNGHYGGIVGRGFDNLKEYASLVGEAKALGADFIKIMVSGIMDFTVPGKILGEPLKPAEIKEMVHIAHEEGLSVMAHANGADTVRAAVVAGADSIEHGNYQDSDSIAALADSKTIWVPTLVTVKNLLGKGRFSDASLAIIEQAQMQSILQGWEAGVTMAAGTDAGAWMVSHGTSLKQEYLAFGQILGSSENPGDRLDDGNRRIMERF